jgi:hypothetical protein
VVRVQPRNGRHQRIARVQQARRVVVAPEVAQRFDLALAGVVAHLPVVPTGGTHHVGRHDVVDEAVAALGDPHPQAHRPIGIERLAVQPEVVRGDLGQRATEGVAGDGDLGDRNISTFILLRIVECKLSKCNCSVSLRVDPPEHHAAIGQPTVLQWLAVELGSAMRHHDVTGIGTLVDRALVAIGPVHVLEHLVGDAMADNIFVAAIGAAHRVHVGIRHQVGISLTA